MNIFLRYTHCYEHCSQQFISFTKLDNEPCKSPRSLYFRLVAASAACTVFPHRTRNRLELENPGPGGFASNGYVFRKCDQL